MKKIFSLLLILSMAIGTQAQKQLSNEMLDFFETKGEAYFKINIDSFQEIEQLGRIVSIDNMKAKNVWAYANKLQFEKFLDLNMEYELLTNPGDLINPKMYNGQKDAYDWDAYPTYEAYVAMMYQFATDYPDICEVFSIGTTNEGRELLFAKISDNVSQNEAEPQFLYTGTMHGDETAGFVLLLRMIDYLTTNYETDAEVTDLVNGMEIWINPAANPDGTYHGGNNSVNGSRRSNALGVDLNRNYADPEDGQHPDGNVWQVETVAFMQMAEENNFVMAANTHGGAEVVNYPWDTWSRLAADDDWWQLVSHEYADTAQSFSPSFYMNGFNDGISNGYAWYSISGGRQDYMNYFHQCREVTLELSDLKLLPESQLDAHWTYNKRSLINYMKQTYYGVRGLITDSITEEPLMGKVEVLNHELDHSYVFSREGLGNYHRLLKAGTYDITYSAGGYYPKTFYDIVVNDYDSTIVNAELIPMGLVVGFSADATTVTPSTAVQFTQECFGDPDTYEWTFEGGNPATSDEANPVVSYNEIGSYDVTLTITKGADVLDITKEDYILVNNEYLMDNMDVTICNGIFMDAGGDGNYSNNEDYTMTIFSDDVSENAVLSVEFIEFNVEDEPNCTYDYLKIYDGSNATSTLIGTYCGTDNPGTVFSTNDDKALTFVFHSDGSQVASGWKAIIDCTINESVHEITTSFLKVFPNPVDNGLIKLQSEFIMNEIQITNMNGQLIASYVGGANTKELDLSHLKSGIYILTVTTDHGVNHKKIQLR